MKDECLICGNAIEYLTNEITMRCELCGKEEFSATRCTNGHYVCNECHCKGIEGIIAVCLNENSDDPAVILERLMHMPFCHMHGPEHHTIVGSALLTAYKNAGGDIDLSAALIEMQKRGKNVPGGTCGFWGTCGAAVSSGIFISIISGATPYSAGDAWSLPNLMVSAALAEIAKTGGPRCCKRTGKQAVLIAVDFVSEHFGVDMKKTKIPCRYSDKNKQCITGRCPFYANGKRKIKIKIKEHDI